jgi:hypothetical protein
LRRLGLPKPGEPAMITSTAVCPFALAACGLLGGK